MKTRFSLIFSLLFFPFHVDLTQAQINKCVDTNGKTVYSQAPCPANARSSNIRPATPAPLSPSSAAREGSKASPKATPTAAELERDFRKRRSEQEEAAKKNAEKGAQAKDREENCKAARGQLASLESGARQQRVDEKGERVFLDDAQIPGELERARRAVQSWCN